VDADVVDRLIAKDDALNSHLDAAQSDMLAKVFTHDLPTIDKVEFHVESQAMGENAAPLVITQSEYMRRMKDMAHIQAGMGFYGEMPDMYTLILNEDHKLVKQVLSGTEEACGEALAPVRAEIKQLEEREKTLRDSHSGKKDEEIPTAEKDELTDLAKKLTEQKAKKDEILNGYAAGNKVVSQLIDLALLQNGMLKGEALTRFVKRSIELI
jgi:molecular chaperone HtpG